MISMMREYARSLKIVLLIVVVVFILTSGVLFYFGTGPFESARSNAVAVVNGEEIPFERFRRAQSNLIAAYERTSRQRLTPELAERLGLSQQVVNELVTEAVVIQGAAKEGVLVSDDELRTTIQQIREFQEAGLVWNRTGSLFKTSICERRRECGGREKRNNGSQQCC